MSSPRVEIDIKVCSQKLAEDIFDAELVATAITYELSEAWHRGIYAEERCNAPILDGVAHIDLGGEG